MNNSGWSKTTLAAANVGVINDLDLSQKTAPTTLQTMQLKHVGLSIAACMPQPVYDENQLKQHLIKVWSVLRPVSYSRLSPMPADSVLSRRQPTHFG